MTQDNNTDTSKPTMLQLILEYLSKTPPLTLMVHMVYIGMVCMFLSMSYIAAFRWSSIVQLYEDAHDINKFITNLKLSVESDNNINRVIQRALEDNGGMRAYVYRYHNGLAAISGVPFFFQSNTHEVISPGAARLMSFEQRIPASIHVAMNNAFAQDQCMMIGDTTTDINSQNYYFYTSRNAEAVLRCPIYMNNGDLFGFVGIDWAHKMEENPKLIDDLHRTAKDLGNIFAVKH